MSSRLVVMGWAFALLVGCSFAGAETAPPPASPIAKEIKHRLESGASLSQSLPRELREAMDAFYAERGFEPAWLDEQRRRTRAADELLAAICDAAAEGLDPRAYRAEALRHRLDGLSPGNGDLAYAAETDLELTSTFFLYATHLRDGRVSAKRARWHFEQVPLELPKVLATALKKSGVADTLQSLVPRHPEYARLRRTLADLRELAARGGYATVPAGKVLELGVEDERVEALRRRLSVEKGAPRSPPNESARRYDEALEAAVRAFQRRHGLDADGKVGQQTLRALNAPIDQQIERVVLNLERLRWLPDDLGKAHVLVNVPGFWLEARRDDKVEVRSPVVVGEEGWNTPVFTDEIHGLEVNPDWVATKKIAAADILPRLQRAPGWAAKKNMAVFERSSGQQVDPGAVDWSAANPDDYRFVQLPGPGNPLGQAKFKMSNPFTIFLHGTPAQEAFERPQRALSHGCIRVRDVDALARFVLGAGDRTKDWDAALASGQKTAIDFKDAKVPVHIVYFTAWVDDERVLQTRPDIYDRDASLHRLLKPDAQPSEPEICS